MKYLLETPLKGTVGRGKYKTDSVTCILYVRASIGQYLLSVFMFCVSL